MFDETGQVELRVLEIETVLLGPRQSRQVVGEPSSDEPKMPSMIPST